MGKLIAVINQKGGVGKTATSINLAYNLTALGSKTLLVDLDPSANTTNGVVKEKDRGNITNTVRELFTDKLFDPTLAIYPLANNFHLMPSNIKLATIEQIIVKRIHKETILSRQLDKIKDNYDYLVMDCGPTLSDINVNAMYAADFILIPVNYSSDAFEGMKDLFDILHEAKENQEYDFKILRNGLDGTKKTMISMVETFLTHYISDYKVFKTIIRQCEDINKAKSENEPISIYAPQSRGANDYHELTKELLSCLG